MKNFKEMLDADLGTFYNTGEFAEVKRIKYDGIENSISVVFDSELEKERRITQEDHVEGIHAGITVARIKLSDLKREPRQGARFFIDGELFHVLSVRTEYNEIIVELERFDE